MTEPNKTLPFATLFFGLLAAREDLFPEVERILQKEYSPIIERSATIPFTQTDYYEREMGAGLLRRWVAVEFMLDPDQLAAVKLHTNRIERLWTIESNGSEAHRQVNIDPGYLDLARVVLASCKDRDHRLFLRSGVYGEVTMSYKTAAKSYQPFPWTYADYRTEEAQEFFLKLRSTHRQRTEAWKERIAM